jgi:CDP-paratose 2-epimerase
MRIAREGYPLAADAPLVLRAMRVLVTGGAGFVGSSLALALASAHPDWDVVAADSLYRRGSELNLPRLREAGVTFVHADVRHLDDLERTGPIDALVVCSAEPSVMAATAGGEDYVVQTNLLGAHNCLRHAARHGAQVVFLSTSRVYPVHALESLDYREGATRFELADAQPVPGASAEGISEEFPLHGARTLYGASKLAAELLVQEYAESSGIATVVNRCGVIAGPWQMGKVDQGVFTHWVLSHHFGRPLSYIGYGGTGKQVRDLLHVADLVALLEEQLLDPDRWRGATVNVGGGRDRSLSLLEATEICRELACQDVAVTAVTEERAGDVPVYITDCRALFERTDWRPRRGARETLEDISTWVTDNEALVRAALS